jgi:hypothetical protein
MCEINEKISDKGTGVGIPSVEMLAVLVVVARNPKEQDICSDMHVLLAPKPSLSLSSEDHHNPNRVSDSNLKNKTWP